MKLDDQGAAFFVECIALEDEDADLPPELATSPLPDTCIPAEWRASILEKNPSVSRSLFQESENESSSNSSVIEGHQPQDSPANNNQILSGTERKQNTNDEIVLGEGAAAGQEPKDGEINVAIQTDTTNIGNKQGKLNRKKRKRRSLNAKHARAESKPSIGKYDADKASEDIFDMDDVHGDTYNNDDELGVTPKHHLILDIKVGSQSGDSVHPGSNVLTSTSVPTTPVGGHPINDEDTTPTSSQPNHSTSMPKLQANLNTTTSPEPCKTITPSTSSAVKPQMSHNSVNENSFLSARLPNQEQLDSMLSKQDSGNSSGEERKRKSAGEIVHYFSEPETYSPITSPIGSRPGSPIMSDSEIMSESSERKKTRKDEEKEKGQQSWEWGQMPSTATSPSQEASRKASQDADGKDESKTTENTGEDSRWTFWWMRGRSESSSNKPQKPEESADSTKKEDKKEENTVQGVPLDSLTTEEEIRKYIGDHFQSSGARKSPPVATSQGSLYGVDSDAESGNGPSLPMSPRSIDGAIVTANQFDREEELNRRFRYKYLAGLTYST